MWWVWSPGYREALGSYAENMKIQAIRKAYQVCAVQGCQWCTLVILLSFQQAIASPRLGIERLWRDYNSFEQVWLFCNSHMTLM